MTSLKQWITPPKQRGEVTSSPFLNYHFTFVCRLSFSSCVRWVLLLNWMPLIQGKALENGEDKCLRLNIDEFKWTIDLVSVSHLSLPLGLERHLLETIILYYKLTGFTYVKVVSLHKIYKNNKAPQKNNQTKLNWVCILFFHLLRPKVLLWGFSSIRSRCDLCISGCSFPRSN